MSLDDEYKRKKRVLDLEAEAKQDDEGGADSGTGTSGGAGGKIEFREFIQVDSNRDDQLSYEEKRRLLILHERQHEGVVKKQKGLHDERKKLKEGKVSLPDFRNNAKSAMSGQYKNHPILSNKAQFSGADPQVNSLPNENDVKTNDEKRNELQYQYNLTNKPENAPKFNPKPIHR